MVSQELKGILEKIKECDFESFTDFLIKYKSIKDSKLTWVEIASIINQSFGKSYSEAYYRRKYGKAELELLKVSITPLWDTYFGPSIGKNDDCLSIIKEKILELKKEKVKVSDERIQNNAYIRRMAREETLLEIASQATEKLNSSLPLINEAIYEPKDISNDAILLLSDWHYGMDFKNKFNHYNPEIAKERISQLLKDTITKSKFNNVEKIHIFNLGDMIAGRIHNTIRYESRFDVITQCIEVSELLAEFLNSLSKHFKVEYYSCLDNHSRLEPIKSESLDLESLCRITDWYLKGRLKYNSNVNINIDKDGGDMVDVNIKSFNISFTHGHKDKVSEMIKNISLFNKKNYDLICTAHRHHFSMDENSGTRIIMNSSLVGCDSYAKDLRLYSKPSQTLIIVSDKNVCESINILELN